MFKKGSLPPLDLFDFNFKGNRFIAGSLVVSVTFCPNFNFNLVGSLLEALLDYDLTGLFVYGKNSGLGSLPTKLQFTCLSINQK